MNKFTIQEKVKIWTHRKHDGELAFPRCVRAHIKEILQYDMYRLSFDELIKFDIEYEEQQVQQTEAVR